MNDFFKIERVTDRITRITDCTFVSMFLAVGDREAALIDTGTGIGNLKEVADRLTDKPLRVLLTHGHVDHAFGAAAFSDVYMSRLDAEIMNGHSDAERRLEYANSMPLPDGITITEDLLAPVPSIETIKDLKDGDVFDLGGLTIEVHAFPGHTPGSMTMLFKEERLLLTGDACNPFTWLFLPGCLSVEEYRETLIAYRERMEGRYDGILLSHGNDILDSELFDNVIECCESVMNGTDSGQHAVFMNTDAYIAAPMVQTEKGFFRADGKFGNIVYSKSNIFKK